MHCDCHIHMALDGSDWKAALARHKTAPDEAFIRATLKNYQALGFDFLRDGGDRWGAGEFAAKIAGEYGICYRTPCFPIYKRGHYGSFIGRGYETLDEFRALVREVKERSGHFIKIMISGLMDSAAIQMSDAEWLNRKAVRAGRATVDPVYTTEDAAGALRLLRPCRYGERIKAAEGVDVRFTDVGHLLGAACVELWLTEDGETRKLVFSGDIGNTNQPLISDPLTIDDADYLVIESTYGNRLHEKPGDTVAELAAVLQRAFDRGGSVIVPAFAVGRTQELLYAIREIKQKRLVQSHDGWPVYLDSPLAEAATAVFMQCEPEYLDAETRNLLRQGINPLWSANLYLTERVEESKKINEDLRPKVILSASGMCDAGRIRHHLKHNLWKWENIILFAGYQAEGTLGRSLLNGAKTVRLFGEEISVSAEVCALHGTSGHADRDGLLQWVNAIARKPRVVFVNHGDEENCEAFRDRLVSEGYCAVAPFSGTAFDLLQGLFLMVTEGQRVEKKSRARKNEVFAQLIEAAQRLVAVAMACREQSNQRLRRFTSEIERLIDTWKD